MATHLELLVEEPSMEAFLHALLPRLLPPERTFQIHAFQGKSDLLGKLQRRGYFKGGLRKIEAARILGGIIKARGNRSASFCRFRDAVLEAIA